MKCRYMEPYFIVDPDHIHHTLDQRVGICVSCDFCGSKMYVPGDRNEKSDLFHKHDVSCQSDVLIAV